MNRRSRAAIGIGVVLLLVAVLWLLRPEASAPGDAAPIAARAGTAAPAPVFAPPIERLAREPQPVAAAGPPPEPSFDSAEAARALHASPQKFLDVGAIMPDGAPLGPFLKREHRELAWISAVASREPLGERLPDSVAPFYSWMGLGQFDRPPLGHSNPHPTVAGYMGTLELPRVMSVYVNLSCGPIVIATQPVDAAADSVLFVIDSVAVSRLAGSLRVRVVSAETRQPIEGAVLELGLGANLQPGGENGHTDDIGLAELRDLAPGPTQLWVSAPGFETCGFDTSIAPATETDFGTVELQPETQISGRAVFAPGEPVDRAYVTLFLDDPALLSSLLCEPFTSTKSDEDGNFTVEHVGRRRYVLLVLASAPDDAAYGGLRKAMVPVDATLGTVGDVLCTLGPAPSVQVINPSGHEGVSIHVRSEAAPFFDWWPDVPYLRSPGDMKVSLVPGRYVMETTVPGQAPRQRTLEVGTEPFTVDVNP